MSGSLPPERQELSKRSPKLRQKKGQAIHGLPLFKRVERRLDRYDVLGLRTFLALGNGEFDRLTFRQRFKAGA